jgi:NADPH-dependent ferric siderophore reductase
MLTMTQAPVKVARPAYRPYRASVARLVQLAPHFVRVTFTGDDFDTFGTDGLDQRIKIVFPIDGHGISDIGADDEATIADGTWYSRWRELPDAQRNPFRTYTIRAVRTEAREVDVDMVSHGDGGPASRWLNGATIGDEVVIVGPDSGSIDSAIGIDWHPGGATQLLLAGDETAAPAICAVLESLPEGRRAQAFIEVPDAADRLPINLSSGCSVTWLHRGNTPVGTKLDPAVRGWVADNLAIIRPALSASAQQLDDVDVDTQLLWDSPAEETDGHFYAWLAGEASAIKLLRRFLVSETGIDRKRIAFMGYWRAGRAEAQ